MSTALVSQFKSDILILQNAGIACAAFIQANVGDLVTNSTHSINQIIKASALRNAQLGIDQGHTISIAYIRAILAGRKIILQPTDHGHAIAMLSQLAGRRHRVYFGICIIRRNDTTTNTILTHKTTNSIIKLRHLTTDQIKLYATQEYIGAYSPTSGIIEFVNGCPSAMIGAPITQIMKVYSMIGLDIRNQYNLM